MQCVILPFIRYFLASHTPHHSCAAEQTHSAPTRPLKMTNSMRGTQFFLRS